MERQKKAKVFGAIAVWDAALTLMAHIHPQCELRTVDADEDFPLRVDTQDAAAMLLVVVAEGAAEKVLRINPTLAEMGRWASNFDLAINLAAKVLGLPPRRGDLERLQKSQVLWGETNEALAKLFRRKPYRRALSLLADVLGAGHKLDAEQVAELVSPYLPSRKRINRDLRSVYQQLGLSDAA